MPKYCTAKIRWRGHTIRPSTMLRLPVSSTAAAVVLVLTTWRVQATSDTATRDLQGGYDDDDCSSFIFQYTSDEGKEFAASLDVDGELDRDIVEFSIASITACGEELDLIRQLQADGSIEAAEIDVPKGIPPNEEREEYVPPENGDGRNLLEVTPYGIGLVQADQLWDLPAPTAPLNVCVVDTGIQDGHVDLPNSVQDRVTGTDTFLLQERFGTWDNDGNGHGTHCAGVIGAIGDNNEGVVGVRRNPDLFTFHIGKGLSDGGTGTTSNVLQAVQGCVDNGAKVISLSLGGNVGSEIEEAYYEYVYNQDILIVAAAGNEGSPELSFPASYPSVMSVAAVGENELWAPFSQFNAQVEITAPGVSVLSAVPRNSYAFLSGTSMATPHVAGVAAEVWSHFPNCTNTQIRNVLLMTAKDLGEKGWDDKYGHGLVQAKDAYDMLNENGCEAGGGVTEPLSDGSPGGCDQLAGSTCTFSQTSGGGVVSTRKSYLVLFGSSVATMLIVMLS